MYAPPRPAAEGNGGHADAVDGQKAKPSKNLSFSMDAPLGHGCRRRMDDLYFID